MNYNRLIAAGVASTIFLLLFKGQTVESAAKVVTVSDLILAIILIVLTLGIISSIKGE